MNFLSKKIFNTLGPDRVMTSECLAHRIGLKSARSLRGKKGKEGVLEIAAKEIFDETGYVLIRLMESPKGVMLTKDEAEIKHAILEWNKWLWQVKATTVDFYEQTLKTINQKQLNFELTGMDSQQAAMELIA